MINRLLYDNFNTITDINRLPISALGPSVLGHIWLCRFEKGYAMEIDKYSNNQQLNTLSSFRALFPGGTLSVFFIRRLVPSIYCLLKKYQEYQAPPPPKKSLKYLQHPKISPFCTFTVRKDPKIYSSK